MPCSRTRPVVATHATSDRQPIFLLAAPGAREGYVAALSSAGARGSTNRVTQPMIHVWLVPVPDGPLTVDDDGAQVVRAAEHMSPPVPRNTMA
jgi:hypothetical protein